MDNQNYSEQLQNLINKMTMMSFEERRDLVKELFFRKKYKTAAELWKYHWFLAGDK